MGLGDYASPVARMFPRRSSIAQRWRSRVDEFAHHSPPRFAVIVFTFIIALWTLLLSLPIANDAGEVTPFHVALFTAVSTICVTGLSVVDMSTYWSPFGNVLVFIGLEVGAIGVLTVASIMGAVVTRRLGLRQRLMAASDSNSLRLHAGPVAESQAVGLGEIGGMLTTVAVSLLAIETVVAVLIYPSLLAAGNDPVTAALDSFYYAASAFTNTGFTPNTEGLTPFASDVWMLGCLMAAMFLGSIGFPVIFALWRWMRFRRRLPVHAKLTLVTTIALFVAGAVLIYALELSNPKTLGEQPAWLQPFTASFLSAMTRSGGLSTVDVGQVSGPTMTVMTMLMFVGGGSASTAGGIKVTTLAILFLAAFSEARGVADTQVFGRRIPNDVLRLGVSVALWGATIVAVVAILLQIITGANMSVALFEAVSAFATCGLSSGLTQQMPPEGSYVLAAAMWLGRVGTVTMAAALASSEHKQLYRLPEERIIVG